MSATTSCLPRVHDAVVKWKDTYLSDYDYLLANWEKYFPKEPRFSALRLPRNGRLQRDPSAAR